MQYVQPAVDETSMDVDAIVEQAQKMQEVRKAITETVKTNIDSAQQKDKMYYDRKHYDPRVTIAVSHYLYTTSLSVSHSRFVKLGHLS